ncbi:hypothetical protein A4X09_0g5147 [Tilletia walkeri]|uniref:SYO1-like TPR repeats domain-containing protein n=1 Tax=Tilletia walkeri TaxID=117179 RepID=A0A8X7T3A9_9BASI|nr:hypothetical protein A4X09_0g5147 [Tilletia walkeri]
MPKSRFRINKAARNDPLARPAASSSSKTSGRASAGGPRSATADPDSPAFAVSLLNKLSLPSTAPDALLPLTEAVWTLSALGSHIASKPIRTALLHPDQRLGQRILHALDPATYAHISGEEDAEDRLALLTQAAGVLRNLCIDAPWGVRDNLGKQGLVARCIAVLQLVIYGQEEQQSHTAGEAVEAASSSLPNKPAEEMNRKEKRLAAKAAAAAGTAPASAATTGETAKTTTAIAQGSTPTKTHITPAFLAVSPHTMPLLDNIVTLLWCLAESSSESLLSQLDGVHLHFGILDEDRSRAQMTSIVLADVLLGSLQVGLEQSQANPPSKPTAKPTTTAGLLQLLASSSSNTAGSSAKAKINHAPGLRQLAVTSANTLCALTDECPGFIRSLLGVQVDPIPSVTSSFPLKDATFIAKSLNSQRFGDVLSTGVRALQASLTSSSSTTHQEHTARTLGVLCAAISRNVVHCASRSDELFAKRKNRGASASSSKKSSKTALVKAPGDAPEVEHAKDVLRLLLKEEQERNVRVLLEYVELEAQTSAPAEGQAQLTGWIELAQLAVGSTSLNGSNAMATDDAAASSTQAARRAQDRVQALQLALETLAELSSAASAVAVAEDAAEQKRAAEHEANIDEEGDHTMGEDGGEIEMEILGREGEGEDESEGGDEDEGMNTDGPGAKGAPAGKNGHSAGGAVAVPFVFALVSEHKLPARLLSVARAILAAQPTAVFPSASSSSGTPSDSTLASTVRAIVSRALSASANALLSVASEAPPTPSEPEYLESLNWDNVLQSHGQASKERFLAWADPGVLPKGTQSEKSGYEALTQLWTEAWQLATGLAEVPAIVGKPLVPSTTGNGAGKSTQGQDAGGAASAEIKEGDEGTDGRVCLEACLSILWAVARSFEPVLGLSRPAQPALFLQGHSSPFRSGPGSTVVPALQAAYLSAHTDSMRVRCLGTLGCVGRVGLFVGDEVDKEELVQRNRAVGETLVAVLEASPAEGVNPATVAASTASGKKKAGGKSANATATTSSGVNLPVTTPECMVAALNAIIDLYADERAEWDVPVFRNSDFLRRLRKLVSRVRASTRAIDKRTDPSLRARADETEQNYRAFVEFRETVR